MIVITCDPTDLIFDGESDSFVELVIDLSISMDFVEEDFLIVEKGLCSFVGLDFLHDFWVGNLDLVVKIFPGESSVLVGFSNYYLQELDVKG